MNTTVSKNHHYVPKAVLRNFCDSGETILRIQRSTKGEIPELKNIDKVFQRFHLNNFEADSGEKDDRIEKFFASELDNFIPGWIEIFENALLSGRLSFATEESRYRFIQFFYNHMRRTPDFIVPIVNKVSNEVLHENLTEEFEKRHRRLSEREREMLESDSWRQRVISNSRVNSLSRQSEKVLTVLASMRIVLATPKRNSKEFIVASNPVARFENYPKQQLGDDGVELWTTLTPKIAVGFAIWNKPVSILALDDDGVRKMNYTLTKNSSAIAGRSAKLLDSLARSAW